MPLYDTIQAAINASSGGDIVVVAPGTYHEVIDFGGLAITVTGSDPAHPELAVIDGQGLGAPVVSFKTNEGNSSVLTGFTIKNGSASGVLCDGASPTIARNVITANAAASSGGYAGIGGGILCAGSANPVIHDNTISSNTAAAGLACGGGIGCTGGAAPQIQRNTIGGNHANTSGGGIGAAGNSQPIIASNTITHNSAQTGGGIFCGSAAAAAITLNTISGNEAVGSGGGIVVGQAGGTIASNRISANHAGTAGGGVYCAANAAPTISNDLLYGNSAASGGGIACGSSSAPSIASDTISGNSATDGGGIQSDGATATVTDCIIAFSGSGGGVSVASGAAPTITFSDVYGNLPANYAGMGDQTGNNSDISADPLFVSPGNGDFHLKSLRGHWTSAGWVADAVHSPCIDAGDGSAFTNEPAPNGGRINLGSDGNTREASLSNIAPLDVTAANIDPLFPTVLDDLYATVTLADDPSADHAAIECQWTKSTDGVNWDAWGHDGQTLDHSNLTMGNLWKARARVTAGMLHSDWVESDYVLIWDAEPDAPETVTITPANPTVSDDLTATATGATDPEGGDVTYQYQWAKSADGIAWGDWGNDGQTLAKANLTKGDHWKARARAWDTMVPGSWTESAEVVVGDSAPSAPTDVTVTPANPTVSDDLTASASGSTDLDAGDVVSYEYQWAKSADGATWGDWGNDGATLAKANLTKGDQWKARARATDGTLQSDWVESAPVVVAGSAPTVPTSVTIAPANPKVSDDLIATASGSTDPDAGDTITYQYQWAKSDDGATWGDWGNDGATLAKANLTRGDHWKARARATDGALQSGWAESDEVVVGDSAPSAPNGVTIAPASPTVATDLTATATGSADPDAGDTVTYEYQWAKSADGTTWDAWGNDGQTLAKANLTRGDHWKARARATDGTLQSDWVESDPVVIGDAAPTAPTSLVITPAAPTEADDLTAAADGGADADAGDTVGYEYQWAKSADGTTWGDWGNDGATLPKANLRHGDHWKARGRSTDGTLQSDWVESNPVVVADRPPTDPTTVTIAPANPTVVADLTATASGSADPDNGDTVTYQYQWAKSADGATWGDWGNDGATLAKTNLAKGDHWKVRARATDTAMTSNWVESGPVVIANSPPSAPTLVSITPSNPTIANDLVATATGVTDPDGDPIYFQFQWARSADGTNWDAWNINTQVLSHTNLTHGDHWKVRARAYDGDDYSDWSESAPVVVSGGAPTAPTSVVIAPASPTITTDLTATASGSADPDGDTVSYQYQWAKSADGITWGAWGNDGATLAKANLATGDHWKAHARATDGTAQSDWVESAPVIIGNSAPTAPTSVVIAPASPTITTDLTAAASGSADPDGDTVSYQYQWAKSADGTTWGAWANDGATLAKASLTTGDHWKAHARATDGTAQSDWVESTPVVIGNSAPTAPTSVIIAPASPTITTDLTATASGSTDPDGDTVSYQYQWAKSADGTTWGAWGNDGATLAKANLTTGDHWKAHARATDGTAQSDWVESAPVTVQGVQVTPSLVMANASGATGTSVSLQATLKRGSTGIAGEVITFSVADQTGNNPTSFTTVGSATTTANGTATLSYGILKPAGAYRLRASFGGDAAYAAASATGTLAVTASTSYVGNVLTWNPSTKNLKLGTSDVAASGWYGLGVGSAKVYITITKTSASITGVISRYSASGTPTLPTDGVAVTISNSLVFNWAKVTTDYYRTLTQTSVVASSTKTGMNYGSPLNYTVVAGAVKKGQWELTHTFVAPDTIQQSSKQYQ
jgi:hypothetical protein